MIKTKSVYDPREKGDGLRVLVTRYWPRGVKKELVDQWVRKVSTPAELIKEYKAGGMDWPAFSARYKKFLSTDEGRAGLEELKDLVKGAGKKPVTLLCSCKEADKCHRSVLKGFLE